MKRNNIKVGISTKEITMKKCAGIYTGPKEEDYIECNNEAEEDSIWCEECEKKMYERFFEIIKRLTKGDEKD